MDVADAARCDASERSCCDVRQASPTPDLPLGPSLHPRLAAPAFWGSVMPPPLAVAFLAAGGAGQSSLAGQRPLYLVLSCPLA